MNELIEKLNSLSPEKRKIFEIEFELKGTEFQNKVWSEVNKIPFGKTVSYLEIANNLQNPNSIRAVGNANSKNKIPIVIPCHRVIGMNGKLVGYSGKLWRKEWLLKHELGTPQLFSFNEIEFHQK